ncbi:hypothetical protein [uncultured Bifidobacterium sp.]|uniref:single-stranded DNA-binding protein n=1 Tax=uncultured Bifidobacterium sp. TaxID=165187 RepID=UPI002584FF65|nr:hypothetical protein [uncultured Bifidobacterium sp.]
MANEPSIEIVGYGFDVKRFQNGGAVLKVSCTPAYKTQDGQWQDLKTMFFDVQGTQYTDRVFQQVEQYLSAGESVQVLVKGMFTQVDGQNDGRTYNKLHPQRIYILGHRPKKNRGGQQAAPRQTTGFIGSSRNQPTQSAQPAQPQVGTANDPWSDDYNAGEVF